jgi:predicted amidohydrolase
MYNRAYSICRKEAMVKKRVEAVAMQLKNRVPYSRNLERIVSILEAHPGSELLVAPEVCLSDYDYDNLDSAADFGEYAVERLKQVVGSRILVLTVLARRAEGYVNEAVVIHDGRVVHRQAKHRLFLLGDEDRYLLAGREEEIVPFEIGGVKYGILICFELRYKELWSRLEDCDVIIVPAQWGVPRKRHLEILASALALVNQCYVVVANSAKEGMACSSGFYSPGGGIVTEDFSQSLQHSIDLTLVRKIRRHIRMR